MTSATAWKIAGWTGLVGLITPAVQTADGGKPRTVTVAVSILPQTWLVGEIGGEHVRTITLVGPGESPHSYQPSDRQVSEVMRADIFFQIGIPLESGRWFQAIVGSNRVAIVDLRQGLELREMNAHSHHDHGQDDADPFGKDPHVWLNPKLLKRQARTVAKALADADPARAVTYETRLDAVLEKLDKLDETIRTLLEPHRGKAVFVFHPAWGYFCDEYGLRQIAVEIEGKEPTDHELTELHRLARKEQARVVFVQPQITGRAAKAIADTIGGRVEIADPLAEDVGENLLRLARAVAASYE